MTQKIVCLLISGIFINGLLAQKPIEELNHLARKYKETPNISYRLNYTYFNGFEGGAALDSTQAYYSQQNKNYYFKAGTVEYLVSEDKFVYVDHEDQEIVVRERAQQTDFPAFTPSQLEALAQQEGVKIEALASKNKIKGLSMAFPKGSPLSKLVLRYDPTTYLMQSAILYTYEASETEDEDANPIRIEVRCYDYNLTQNRFAYTLGQFVKKGKSGYLPVPRLKGYKIV